MYLPPPIVFKARLILEEKGHILLLKQTTSNGGKYTLIGGTVEPEEFALQALIRESKEEAGISLNPHDLELVHTLHKKRKKDIRIVLYFRTKRYKGHLRARETEKFSSVKWFAIHQLPQNLSPTVEHVLKMYQKGIRYSEYTN